MKSPMIVNNPNLVARAHRGSEYTLDELVKTAA